MVEILLILATVGLLTMFLAWNTKDGGNDEDHFSF